MINKYEKIYKDLMIKAKQRSWYSKKYNIGKEVTSFPIETHHILPRCLGGLDDKDNLAVLSLREHFIAHLLLTKLYPDNDKIITAFQIMSKRCKKNSKNYKILRENYYRISSERTKRYFENPENRKAIDLVTKKVYNSCVELASHLGMKYVTVKRRLYKNPHKYNYMWLDEYKKGEQNGKFNLQKNVTSND